MPDRELCSDLAEIDLVDMPDGGCVECLAMGSSWVHLRYCVTCGETRCCDDSPNRHARAHFGATGHPVIRSKEAGEHWAWCFEHEASISTA